MGSLKGIVVKSIHWRFLVGSCALMYALIVVTSYFWLSNDLGGASLGLGMV